MEFCNHVLTCCLVASTTGCGKSSSAWLGTTRRYAKAQARADREVYITSEDKAKADRTGLWSDANPTLPWEFRHPEKAATQH